MLFHAELMESSLASSDFRLGKIIQNVKKSYFESASDDYIFFLVLMQKRKKKKFGEATEITN